MLIQKKVVRLGSYLVAIDFFDFELESFPVYYTVSTFLTSAKCALGVTP